MYLGRRDREIDGGGWSGGGRKERQKGKTKREGERYEGSGEIKN